MNQVTRSSLYSALYVLVATALTPASSFASDNSVRRLQEPESNSELLYPLSEQMLFIDGIGECKHLSSSTSRCIIFPNTAQSSEDVSLFSLYIGTNYNPETTHYKDLLDVFLFGLKSAIENTGLHQRAKDLGVTLKIQSRRNGIVAVAKGPTYACIDCLQAVSCLIKGNNLTEKEFSTIQKNRINKFSTLRKYKEVSEPGINQSLILLGSDNYMKDLSSLPGYVETIHTGTYITSQIEGQNGAHKPTLVQIEFNEQNKLQPIQEGTPSLIHNIYTSGPEEKSSTGVCECGCSCCIGGHSGTVCGSPDDPTIAIHERTFVCCPECTLDQTIYYIHKRNAYALLRDEFFEIGKQFKDDDMLGSDYQRFICRFCKRSTVLKKNHVLTGSPDNVTITKDLSINDKGITDSQGNATVMNNKLYTLLEQIDAIEDLYALRIASLSSLTYEQFLVFANDFRDNLFFSIGCVSNITNSQVSKLMLDIDLILTSKAQDIQKETSSIYPGITKCTATYKNSVSTASLVISLGQNKDGNKALQEICVSRLMEILYAIDSRIDCRCISSTIDGELFVIIKLTSSVVDRKILEYIALSSLDTIRSMSNSNKFVEEEDIPSLKDKSEPFLDKGADISNKHEILENLTEICTGDRQENYISAQRLTFLTANANIINEFVKSKTANEIKSLLVVS